MIKLMEMLLIADNIDENQRRRRRDRREGIIIIIYLIFSNKSWFGEYF